MDTKIKDDFLITIIGEQNVDGQNDKIEVITTGHYFMKNNSYFISYKEFDEETPDKFYNNYIKVSEQTVTITRKGPMQSQLILENGRRHQCFYKTLAGDITIGVYTKSLINNLSADGGELKASYTLDFNADLASINKFTVKIEKNNTNEVK